MSWTVIKKLNFMEPLYSSVGKNNVRQIAVDFSCEFKHLQSPEWAGQEPKKWHCMTSEESKTSQGCGMDLLCFCWQNGKIYFMKCSNNDCWFIFPSSVKAEVCPSSPLTPVWQSHTHPKSTLVSHWWNFCSLGSVSSAKVQPLAWGSIGNLALSKSCKQSSWILSKHFLYRLLMFLSFVLAFV